MNFIHQSIDYFLHIDVHLYHLVEISDYWSYIILFLIIFSETGLVIFPFLPGDSLLFAVGSLAAISELNIHYLVISLCIAAILGDSVNYAVGQWTGPKVFSRQDSILLNQSHLQKAHDFYQRYGGKTIIIARFVPIIRTFAPFVAGIGKMHYSRFLTYNIIGAVLWICSLLYVGFYFGNIPLIKQHFPLAIITIIALSILFPIIDWLRTTRSQSSKLIQQTKEN